jgi:hypothetical protein
MQVNKSDQTSLPPSWQSDKTRQVNMSNRAAIPKPQNNKGASSPLQSIELLNPDLWYLLIQRACSPQDALALSALDKAALTGRFDHPRLQHLHFKTAAAITEFLSYYQALPETAEQGDTLRTQAHFKQIKTLALTVSAQLTAEQCVSLFSSLPNIKQLKIYVMAGQRVASLGPLLKAAQPLGLQQLSIARSSDRIPVVFLKDYLPAELWQLPTLEILKLHGLDNIKYIPEDIERLTALKCLKLSVLHGLKVLPKNLWRLELETLVLKEFDFDLESMPEEINTAGGLKLLKLQYLYNLETLPETIWEQNTLETLVLERLDHIQEIPDKVSQLTSLISLELRDMRALHSLPAFLSHLPRLREIRLRNMPDVDIPQELEPYIRLDNRATPTFFSINGIAGDHSWPLYVDHLALTSIDRSVLSERRLRRGRFGPFNTQADKITQEID